MGAFAFFVLVQHSLSLGEMVEGSKELPSRNRGISVSGSHIMLQ